MLHTEHLRMEGLISLSTLKVDKFDILVLLFSPAQINVEVILSHSDQGRRCGSLSCCSAPASAVSIESRKLFSS